MQTCKEENIANGQAMLYPSTSAHSCALGLSACLHTKLTDLKKANLNFPCSPEKLIFFLLICMYTYTQGHIYVCEREKEQTVN